MSQRIDRDGGRRRSLEKEVIELAVEKKSAEERLAAAEEKVKQLTEERDVAAAKAEELSSEAKTQALRVSDVESELAIMKADLEAEVAARTDLQTRLTEKEIEVAGGAKKLVDSSCRLAKQELLLRSLSDKLRTAEKGIEAAKTHAVEAFKNSEAFTEHVADSSADSYRLGFADCKEAVSKSFPDLDLKTIQPPGEEEEEKEEVEEAVAGFVDEVIEAFQVDEEDVRGEPVPTTAVPDETSAQAEDAAPS